MSEVINAIEFGCENMHFAKILSEETFETPEKIKGMVSLKLSGKSSTKTLPADNGTYFEIASNSGYEIELEIYNYDDSIKTKYLGFVKDKNGVLVEPDIIIPTPLSLLFEVRGDKLNRAICLYNCTFEKPDVTFKTVEEENIEVEVVTLKGKAKPFKFGEKGVVQASTTDANKKTTWFTSVYKPIFNGVGG